ncbi:MAG TPA: hypothetical protein VEQ12_04380, partial [Candidatus Limnocylindria bacterium]|nr:hypothetical protein [Candidatus Limnocylindria bacterium]
GRRRGRAHGDRSRGCRGCRGRRPGLRGLRTLDRGDWARGRPGRWPKRLADRGWRLGLGAGRRRWRGRYWEWRRNLWGRLGARGRLTAL